MKPGAEHKIRVLLVEDDEDDYVLVRDLFDRIRPRGHQLDWARTYPEGRALWTSGDHDVCLIDYRLGERDGIELVKDIRASGDARPLILLTGQGDHDVDVEAMRAGASDYLVKAQVTADLLERTVRYSVTHFRAEDGRRRLASILEETPDFVATLSPDGRPQFVNRAGRELLSLTAPIGEDFSLRRLFVEDTARALESVAIHSALETGAWRGEGVMRAGPGGEIPVSLVVVAHRRPDGGLAYLSTIARDISESRRQARKIVRLSRIQAVLSGINGTIVRVRDRQELFDEACRLAVEQGGFLLAGIGMVDENNEVELVARAGQDQGLLDGMRLSGRADMPGGSGLTGQALRSRSPVVCNDIETDSRNVVERARLLSLGIRSLVILPLVVDDRSVGVVFLCGGDRHLFDDDEMRLLREVAGDIAFALDHIGKAEQLQRMAYFDLLTDLPNRALFGDRLAQLLLGGTETRSLAVVLCDIDRLRSINDTFGQSFGDEVLRTLGRRLSESVPPGATVARLGTDDFGIVLTDADDASAVGELLDGRILPRACSAVEFQGEELRLSLHCGVAIAPGDGRTPDALMANAEAALRRATSTGERFVFYEPGMNARVAERLTLQNRLQRALERGQFELHYQPKFSLKTNAVVGFEALIRWNDPERGMVPPAEFIPLLEDSGLIVEVGRWVMRQAVADRAGWIVAGYPALPVAVNVSPAQLRLPGFVDHVRDALDVTPAPGVLDLEITEGLFMEDLEGSIERLLAVRALGAGVCIDDFGTGYSSLRYIARLPVDTLKIDRTFVSHIDSNPDNVAIVSTVITLAHALDLRVVAEGVETRDQLNLLRLLKCDDIQGYIVSRPLPAAAAAELTRRENLAE